jgi:hypothetical protein
MKELLLLLKSWKRLWKIELSGNPFCFKSKYRERIIVAASNIEILDGKEINNLRRQFLQNWKASRETYQQQQLKSKIDFSSSAFGLKPQTNDLPNISSYQTTFLMPGN